MKLNQPVLFIGVAVCIANAMIFPDVPNDAPLILFFIALAVDNKKGGKP